MDEALEGVMDHDSEEVEVLVAVSKHGEVKLTRELRNAHFLFLNAANTLGLSLEGFHYLLVDAPYACPCCEAEQSGAKH